MWGQSLQLEAGGGTANISGKEGREEEEKERQSASKNTDLASEVAKIGLWYSEPMEILPCLPAFFNLPVTSAK